MSASNELVPVTAVPSGIPIARMRSVYQVDDVGRKLAGDAIGEFYKPGQEVIVAFDGNRATVVRPPH